jgi:hypothetical protein
LFWTASSATAASRTSATSGRNLAAAFSSAGRHGTQNSATARNRKMDSYGRVIKCIARPSPSRSASRRRGAALNRGSAPNTRQPEAAIHSPPQYSFIHWLSGPNSITASRPPASAHRGLTQPRSIQ